MEKEKLINNYKKSPVTYSFIGIIITYFIIMTLNGGTTNPENLVRFGALYPPFVLAYNEYYRLVTSIFIHIGLMHLLFNGYALYIFGTQIEKVMGSFKYLQFFLLAGIGGNVVTFLFSFNTISAGASGSLFGILGAFVYLIRHHANMITQQGKRTIYQIIGINIIITFISPSISITAHLGGLVIGYLLSYIFIK